VGEVKWVRLIDDLSNCMYRNKRAGFPEETLSFMAWLNSLKGRRVIAEFEKSDPYPAIRYWGQFLAGNTKTALLKLKRYGERFYRS
jgi:hypothetical protein